MTVPAPENQPPVDNGNPDPNQNPGHPAWQEILDVLPDEFHGLVKPKLEQWDNGVRTKLQEVQQQYDPYKDLVQQGVSPDTIQQALYLANLLETEPESVVERAVEHFNLERFKPRDDSTGTNIEDEGFNVTDDGAFDGLENDPRFQALMEQQQRVTEWIEQQQAEREQQQSTTQLEQYLGQLHEQHGGFDDLYVTALLAQGIDGKVAVEQFQNTVNQAAQALAGTQQQQQTPTAPVVMGSGGTTGSGQPNQPIDFAAMPKGDFNDMVTAYLRQSDTNET